MKKLAKADQVSDSGNELFLLLEVLQFIVTQVQKGQLVLHRVK